MKAEEPKNLMECLDQIDSAKAEFSNLVQRHTDLMEKYEFAGSDLQRFGNSVLRDQFCTLEADLMKQLLQKVKDVWKLERLSGYLERKEEEEDPSGKVEA